jgi:hypothetical protein
MNENLLYRTDTLRFFGDLSTVTVGPDVRHVWVDSEYTPLLLNEEISDWEKAPNIMPSTIPAYWMRKKEYNLGRRERHQDRERRSSTRCTEGAYIRLSASPHDLAANIGRDLLEHCVFAIEYRLSKHIPDEFSHPFPATLFDAL